MPWFQVDDQLSLHRKVSAAGNGAMGLWVRAGSWSMQNLTDGFIPTHIARVLGTQLQIKKLIEVRLWHTVPGGYQFHEWDERQMSAADIAERRRKRAEAGAKGGRSGSSTQASASANAVADAQPIAEAGAQAKPKQNGTPGPGPVLNGVTKGGGVTQGDDPEPPRYCNEHPNDTTDYCRPCIVRRKAHDAWKTRQADRERATAAAIEASRREIRELIDDCTECDDFGRRDDLTDCPNHPNLSEGRRSHA